LSSSQESPSVDGGKDAKSETAHPAFRLWLIIEDGVLPSTAASDCVCVCYTSWVSSVTFRNSLTWGLKTEITPRIERAIRIGTWIRLAFPTLVAVCLLKGYITLVGARLSIDYDVLTAALDTLDDFMHSAVYNSGDWASMIQALRPLMEGVLSWLPREYFLVWSSIVESCFKSKATEKIGPLPAPSPEEFASIASLSDYIRQIDLPRFDEAAFIPSPSDAGTPPTLTAEEDSAVIYRLPVAVDYSRAEAMAKNLLVGGEKVFSFDPIVSAFSATDPMDVLRQCMAILYPIAKVSAKIPSSWSSPFWTLEYEGACKLYEHLRFLEQFQETSLKSCDQEMSVHVTWKKDIREGKVPAAWEVTDNTLLPWFAHLSKRIVCLEHYFKTLNFPCPFRLGVMVFGPSLLTLLRIAVANAMGGDEGLALLESSLWEGTVCVSADLEEEIIQNDQSAAAEQSLILSSALLDGAEWDIVSGDVISLSQKHISRDKSTYCPIPALRLRPVTSDYVANGKGAFVQLRFYESSDRLVTLGSVILPCSPSSILDVTNTGACLLLSVVNESM